MVDLLVTCPVCSTSLGEDCEPLPDSHSPLLHRHDRLRGLLEELDAADFIPEEFEEEVQEILTLCKLAAHEEAQ